MLITYYMHVILLYAYIVVLKGTKMYLGSIFYSPTVGRGGDFIYLFSA